MLSDIKGLSHNDRKQLLSLVPPIQEEMGRVLWGEEAGLASTPAHPCSGCPIHWRQGADLQEARALVPAGNCSEVFHVDLLTNTVCRPKGISTAESHTHGSRSENLGSAILKKGFF